MATLTPHAPDRTLLYQVRAAFTARGTSLHRWCEANKLDRSHVCRALTGERASAKAKRLRARALKAAGVQEAV